jgi:hypothetical protein
MRGFAVFFYIDNIVLGFLTLNYSWREQVFDAQESPLKKDRDKPESHLNTLGCGSGSFHLVFFGF